MKLTVIRGVPGTGKSTYAKKHYDCLILENDMFQTRDGRYCWSTEGTKKAIGLVYRITEETLRNGADVVVANTFTRRRFVECYARLAKETGAKFEVIRMTKEYGNVHSVPASTLDSMKENFEDWDGEKLV